MEVIKYFALSGVGIALFYILDRLFLSNTTLLKTQRYYYLFAIIASLTLPLIADLIPLSHSRIAEADIPTFTITMSEEVVVTTREPHPIDWLYLTRLVWVAGVLLTLARTLVGDYKLRKIRKASNMVKLSDRTYLYLTPNEIAPFTYNQSIYIPQSMRDTEIFDSVLLHELEHMKQRHYIDIKLGFVLQLAQWWNPFAWSMLSHQRKTLEYLADQGVLRQGKDKKTYQYHLLECTVGRTVTLPSLSFSMQNLKQRIFMMNSKSKSGKSLAVIYALAAIPVVALLLLGTQIITIKSATASETTETTPPPSTDEEVFEYTDNMPAFPGGMNEMMKWLSDNVVYPKEAVDKNIQGRVMIRFIVEKNGSISSTKVVHSVNELLDAEALRVVNAMPKWEPGTKNNKAVRVRFTLPIQFRLSGNSEEGKVYEKLDEMPSFPGGPKAMMKWLSDNINYPKEDQGNIQGRVIVSYIVEADGTITNAKVVKSLHELFDKEALRVVNAMPKWNPGKLKDGTAVRTKFTTPVLFKLK